VKPDVRGETEENAQKTQELLKKLPHEVLELYDNVGGEVHITDKKLTQHEELNDSSYKDMSVINSEEKVVSLKEHFVFAIGGREPSLIIHAEDYASHPASKE
ncbi:lethal factor domain protein, partial [Bacillus cereus]